MDDVSQRGWHPIAENRHGFLLSNGVVTTIDPPNAVDPFTAATGINNSGQIVGLYFDADFNRHDFFLSKDVYMLIDVPHETIGVPDAKVTATDVFSINEQGEIVGYYDVDGNDVPDESHCYVGTHVR
jgi:hypothetical protein